MVSVALSVGSPRPWLPRAPCSAKSGLSSPARVRGRHPADSTISMAPPSSILAQDVGDGVWIDLGVMEYGACWEVQRARAQSVQEGLLPDTLLLVRHPPVLTLGASFHEENLLLSRGEYSARGIQIERTDRGGDVTYHGPGQLVIYPIFDLSRHGRDLHAWMRGLEETMIQVCATFGLSARRFPPHTGAWIGDRKVAAIGVKVRRWVNLHGIALNCSTDIGVFDLIVPCGIQGYGVTSISAELGQAVEPEQAITPTVRAFENVFGTRLAPARS